eukprot:327087-Rhodomonas_salina.1
MLRHVRYRPSAMRGTDIAYGATRAARALDRQGTAIQLRLCYAMSGRQWADGEHRRAVPL